MMIDFTCQKCEASFEIDAQDLIDGTEKLTCPHCEAKAPPNLVEDFVAALTEIRSQVAALSKKFALTMSVETDDLKAELEAEDDDEEDGDDEDLEFEDDDVEDDEEEDVEDEDADEP